MNEIKELVVPHSPCPELKICVMERASDWMAWWDAEPSIWETGTTYLQAIGSLMSRLQAEGTGVEIEIKERNS